MLLFEAEHRMRPLPFSLFGLLKLCPYLSFKHLSFISLSNGKERRKWWGVILPSFSYTRSMGGMLHKGPWHPKHLNLHLEFSLFTLLRDLSPVLSFRQHFVLMHMTFLIPETFGWTILRCIHWALLISGTCRFDLSWDPNPQLEGFTEPPQGNRKSLPVSSGRCSKVHRDRGTTNTTRNYKHCSETTSTSEHFWISDTTPGHVQRSSKAHPPDLGISEFSILRGGRNGFLQIMRSHLNINFSLLNCMPCLDSGRNPVLPLALSWHCNADTGGGV